MTTYLPWLEDTLDFPDPSSALDDPNGLLAAGGDLSAERLVSAYKQGIFPWYSDDQPILWWSPNPRCVVLPNQAHISRSLKKHIRKHGSTVTFDTKFDEVIRHCARLDSTEGTWITAEMEDAYIELNARGIAHSVEAWENNQLIGGLYGLAIGRCFFGESMFSLGTNGSKIAFAALSQQLFKWGYQIIDCQVENPHLFTLGAETIPRDQFLSILKQEVNTAPADHSWKFTDWNWEPNREVAP